MVEEGQPGQVVLGGSGELEVGVYDEHLLGFFYYALDVAEVAEEVVGFGCGQVC